MASRQSRIALTVALVLATILVPFSVIGQSQGQNDAGLGRDAPNSRGDALEINANQRYRGQIVSGSDNDDWFRFDIATLGGTSGRPVADLVLTGVPSNTLHLELYRDDGSRAATGTGTGGVRAIHYSLDDDGAWTIHVGRTPPPTPADDPGGGGQYELTFQLRAENDAGKGRDAGDGDSSSRIDLGAMPANGFVIRGEMSPGDETDSYRFTPPDTETQILAAIHYPDDLDPEEVDLGVSVEADGGFVGGPQNRVGDSFQTSHHLTGSGNWQVDVTNSDPAVGAPYILTLRVVPSATDAGADGGDAGATFSSAANLAEGLHTGHLSRQGDTEDRYKFTAQAGDIIALGASSYEHDSSFGRPLIQFTVYRPNENGGSPVEYQTFVTCGEADGIFVSAVTGGTWHVGVREIGGATPCEGAVTSGSGNYGISLEIHDQTDIGTTDAQTPTTGAPDLPNSLLHRGWLDRHDSADTYELGSFKAGTTVRAGLTTTQDSLAARLLLFDGSGNILASSSSGNGRARIHQAVGVTSDYFLRIDQGGSTTGAAGEYFVYAISFADSAPLPVSLGRIQGGDVTTNTVDLSWSRAADDDFDRYEVHFSEAAGFTPSDATRYENITNREQTSTTVEDLHPGHTYEFLIRVYDDNKTFSDSNRRSGSTAGGLLENSAPSLEDGAVTPDQGGTSTLFQFSVRYSDPEGDPPAERHVFVSGEPHVMEAHGDTWEDGVLFTLNTTLKAGEHSHFFRFSDGEMSARDPPEDAHEGPLVTSSGNRPPRIEASANPRSGDAPLPVKFDVAATDADNDPLNYSWDFDISDGIQSNSVQKSPSHTYQTRGQFTAMVSVRDSKGAESTDSVTITVSGKSNTAPTARATATPSEGRTPLVVQFNAGANDPDGRIASYSWDFDNANGYQKESSDPNPTHTFTRGGSFVVTVTVTDDGGQTATSSVLVSVRTEDNLPPSVIVDADPREGSAPLEVVFTAQAADADGDEVTVSWDFDSEAGFSVDANGTTVNHTYTRAGKYTAMAVVKDANGATATGVAQIEVTGAGGATGEGGLFILADPKEGKAPLTVAFDVDDTSFEGTLTSYSWDFGDDTEFSSEKSPTHTFQRAGTFIVTLTATDDNGTDYQSTIVIRSTGPEGRGSPGLGLVFVAVTLVGTLLVMRRRYAGPK